MTDSAATQSSEYRGRFAPSPTGRLHMGSLVAAAASYLRAKQAGGTWLLRIEDIDPPREEKGAADSFLTTLESFGFEWDGPVVYQSNRMDRYREALQSLADQQHAYRCQCSRRVIRLAIERNHGPSDVYPGTCLNSPPRPDKATNWRARMSESHIEFDDLLQGHQSIRFGQDKGDFVIWRKDDLPSYQLAVTVDDIAQGITEVVRGIDLLQETGGQIALRKYFAADSIKWMHLPMIVDSQGHKLSKQTAATPVDNAHAAQQLCTAMQLLGLELDGALKRAAVRDIWAYALNKWRPNKLLNQQKSTLGSLR